jgi:hypothetical protein
MTAQVTKLRPWWIRARVAAAARAKELESSAVTESSSYLAATAESYDAVAVSYADFVQNELDGLPLDAQCSPHSPSP